VTTENVKIVAEKLKRAVVLNNATKVNIQNEVDINNAAKVIEHILDATSTNLQVKTKISFVYHLVKYCYQNG